MRDRMTDDIVRCFDDRKPEEAASLMPEKQIRRLPVLNRDRRLVGIVSLGDIARHEPNPEPAGETLAAVSRG